MTTSPIVVPSNWFDQIKFFSGEFIQPLLPVALIIGGIFLAIGLIEFLPDLIANFAIRLRREDDLGTAIMSKIETEFLTTAIKAKITEALEKDKLGVKLSTLAEQISARALKELEKKLEKRLQK